MPNLTATHEELLSLFPREIEGLEVFVRNKNVARAGESAGHFNQGNEIPGWLSVLYIQPDTSDEFRNWDSYAAWLPKSEEHDMKRGLYGKQLPPPPDFNKLYLDNIDLFGEEVISIDDKILFEFSISVCSHNVEKKDFIAYLGWIRRNPGEEYRGAGAEVYKNITKWLREKGYLYLTLTPAEGRDIYFNLLGLSKIGSLKTDSIGLFKLKDKTGPTDIHFLGDDWGEHI